VEIVGSSVGAHAVGGHGDQGLDELGPLPLGNLQRGPGQLHRPVMLEVERQPLGGRGHADEGPPDRQPIPDFQHDVGVPGRVPTRHHEIGGGRLCVTSCRMSSPVCSWGFSASMLILKRRLNDPLEDEIDWRRMSLSSGPMGSTQKHSLWFSADSA
jgi:hypothetical protein